MKSLLLISCLGACLAVSGCVATPPPQPIALEGGVYVLTLGGMESPKGEKYLIDATEQAVDFCWAKEGTSTMQVISSDTRDAIEGYRAVSRIRFICR